MLNFVAKLAVFGDSSAKRPWILVVRLLQSCSTSDILGLSHSPHRSLGNRVTCIKGEFFFCALIAAGQEELA